MSIKCLQQKQPTLNFWKCKSDSNNHISEKTQPCLFPHLLSDIHSCWLSLWWCSEQSASWWCHSNQEPAQQYADRWVADRVAGQFYISITTMYLSPGHQLHEGPAVLMSDQLHDQLLASRQLMDAVVPPRGASAGWRRGGRWGGWREDRLGGFRRRSSI